MAHIEPFRAFRYDPAQVALSQVVTQPYDKITPEMQAGYYRASPYNLVRIILGERKATDTPADTCYTRAAAFFQEWRRQGVLRQDSEPAIYRYVQRFAAPMGGRVMERQGFIALGRIEDYSAATVFRHEQTLSKPKADRLDLLRATRAHFGQIFMLYSDPGLEVENALATADPPRMEVEDEYGVLHQVWQVADAEIVQVVRAKMQDKKLVIADGHHRYETALNYRDERRGADRGGQKEIAAAEFVMMTFVNMDSAGLLVLPTHRVVHGLSAFSMDKFRTAASEYFSVEEADGSLDARRATIMLREAAHTGPALMAISQDRAFLMSRAKAPAEVFRGLSFRQQSLDVVQLHKCLLERALGISEEAIRNQQNLSYIRDTAEAIGTVREGKADVAFLMNPAKVGQVRDIALAGEVMPQKSTDFYPKLLSGLTIYALE